MRKTFTTAKDETISLTLNGKTKKKKTGMFTHKKSGIHFKIKRFTTYSCAWPSLL